MTFHGLHEIAMRLIAESKSAASVGTALAEALLKLPRKSLSRDGVLTPSDPALADWQRLGVLLWDPTWDSTWDRIHLATELVREVIANPTEGVAFLKHLNTHEIEADAQVDVGMGQEIAVSVLCKPVWESKENTEVRVDVARWMIGRIDRSVPVGDEMTPEEKEARQNSLYETYRRIILDTLIFVQLGHQTDLRRDFLAQVFTEATVESVLGAEEERKTAATELNKTVKVDESFSTQRFTLSPEHFRERKKRFRPWRRWPENIEAWSHVWREVTKENPPWRWTVKGRNFKQRVVKVVHPLLGYAQQFYRNRGNDSRQL